MLIKRRESEGNNREGKERRWEEGGWSRCEDEGREGMRKKRRNEKMKGGEES